MDRRHLRPHSNKKEIIAEVPFAYNIAEKVLDKLRSLASSEIFTRGLKEVEDTLSSMKGVLLDADEQQAENLELRDWLRRLKEVCYDADNVLDEIEYVALWQRQSNKRKVRNFFLSSSPIHFKMREIRERLVEIEAEKGNFHLNERTEDRHLKKREDRHLNERTETDKHSDLIIGRDDDKEEIVRRLLMQASDDYENVSVISIVGRGGVGKTTIAQLVYYDERVSRHFQLKMWVHVSRDSDFGRLMKKIINSVTDINDHFSKYLQDIVRDKRFLLVLDDVWDPNPLNELKQDLMVGANGSKIIITTRHLNVYNTDVNYKAYQHHLKSLTDVDSWSLFMKSAFREGETHLYPNLMKIGTELVKRCGGHLLSARILGSLLSSTTDECYWLSIRDSGIWNSKQYESSLTSTETEIWNWEEEENNIIPPALRLSYNAMPSYLKQCFSYSSIFNKASEIIDTELIQMWIAQGFIRPFDENQELEDIGHRYFQELCSLSFFQIVEQKPLYCTFKMHDLIHDLARLVAQGEHCIVSSNGHNISEKVQHVSLSFTSFWEQNNVLHNVRTILIPTLYETPTSYETVDYWLETCPSRFKLLRVLDFRTPQLYELPISIGNLKHLRYLNISNNRSIKMLPTCICKLNLQSLRLDGCWKLEKLPSDIGNLINLRHLLLTTKQMFLPKEGIGNLKSLRFLGIVECANLKSLGEGLQGLTALRTLLISDCGNLEFLPSSMEHLTALETLSIENCEKLILTEWEEDIQDLRLSLQTLFITRLPQLETLPQWLQGAKDTLQLISIRDCWDLKALPEWLQYLASLQKLEISLCPRLWALPEGMRYLTALRELKIEDCPELNRRCEEGTGKDWPKIAHVAKIVRLERTSEMFRNRKRLLNKLLFLNQ